MQTAIKMIVMDVDGTLTDGHIYMGATGEMMKAFNVKDGMGIVEARKYGVVPVIITGRESEIVKQRCKELGITEIYQGIHDKRAKLQQIAVKYKIQHDEIAYIGDDLNDIECMKLCGLSACPQDAVEEVKTQVDYLCKLNGGNGAVREFLDLIIKHNRTFS